MQQYDSTTVRITCMALHILVQSKHRIREVKEMTLALALSLMTP